MTPPEVSVVIVSRGRAADLPLCLLGVSQLAYPTFEVVLVADKAGLDAVRGMALFAHLKTVQFDEANISRARNLGIAQAAGSIVAFIDDDAVPEPTWLTYLTAGFADPDVSATGGFVRGRNGISFQWKTRAVDGLARTEPLEIAEDKVTILTGHAARAIKTEGTNMAVRRDVLVEMGGFDPAYRFYLDETDLNMRLAQRGAKTALAPRAQVHHGYKASETRRADRVPRDLTQIGASLAVYLRKYAAPPLHAARIKEERADQRRRLLRHMIAGALEPRDIRRLLTSFDAGLREGLSRDSGTTPPIPHASQGFSPMPADWHGAHILMTSRAGLKATLHRAQELTAQRQRVSIYAFSKTARPHRVVFTQDGLWLQSGGLYGRSDRVGPRIWVAKFPERNNQEARRVQSVRISSDDVVKYDVV